MECELTATCPYFQGEYEDDPALTKKLRGEYCYGAYHACGRYRVYMALEKNRQAENLDFAAQGNHRIRKPEVKVGHS